MAKTPILTKDGLVRYDENIKDYIDTGLEDKVSKTDIVDNLVSTATDLPLSANQGRVLNEDIDNLEIALRTGVNLSGGDFNNFGLVSINGQGSNMTNAPIDNPSCGYIVHQIVGENTILQFAKATNWNNGELLFFRQMRANGVWGEWLQVGLQNDIETLKSQTRKCYPYIHFTTTNIIYISASFKYDSKGIIEFKGSHNSGSSIYSFIQFDEANTPKIKITNWGSTQLEIVSDSISYVKDATPDITDIKFALKGVSQWTSIDVEFPVRTVSMSISDTAI